MILNSGDQNDENLELIAQQNAELEQLREQLQVQVLPPVESNEMNDDVQKLLSEKEELLKGQEMELENLRQHMEQLQAETARKEIPSIVVNGEEEEDDIQKLLNEKEELLASKEKELEEMRHKLELEQAEAAKPALAEVQEQLEHLRSQVKYRQSA